MKSSLLLSLLVLSAVAFGEVANNPAATIPADGSSATASDPYAGMPEGLNALDHTQANGRSGENRVCMKIRAFIFETNDDQVPRFVRETTCPPVTWRAMKIKENHHLKFVPAAGANPF
jgi:hypothetical protein